MMFKGNKYFKNVFIGDKISIFLINQLSQLIAGSLF